MIHADPRPPQFGPLVIQDSRLLANRIRTVSVVPLTGNTSLEVFPGNVLIPAEASRLDRDSVALVTQITTLDRDALEPYPVGRLPAYLLRDVEAGLRLVLGL